MGNYERLKNWISNNKQVGERFSYEKNGELCWSSVAIQQHEDKIVVFIDEIMESKMAAEEYLREEIIKFDNIDDALKYVSTSTRVCIDELKPCKGQKIFNVK